MDMPDPNSEILRRKAENRLSIAASSAKIYRDLRAIGNKSI